MMITIQILTEKDQDVLARVASGVFDHEIIPELAERFVTDPRHHIAVAQNEAGEVVGMATGVHYLHPDKREQFFVNEVGVAPGYQRQGIGLRLVEELLAHARRLGCEEAWVATEVENDPARNLYRKAGGQESPDLIVMYTFPLKKRPPPEP
jgi:ribosomal protein S18 acetylase RimI-like enzyme